MSREYYMVCHQCKTKVHFGCDGFSGLQFWGGVPETNKAAKKFLENCLFHNEYIGFVWEQSIEDEEYRNVEDA